MFSHQRNSLLNIALFLIMIVLDSMHNPNPTIELSYVITKPTGGGGVQKNGGAIFLNTPFKGNLVVTILL